MFSLYQTLSLRYLSRHWLRAVLIIASIALGVGVLVATHALNLTMSRAALAYGNPVAGVVDFMVTNGELRVPLALVPEMRQIPGVAGVYPRIHETARLIRPGTVERNVLVLGLDINEEVKKPNVSDEVHVDAATIVNFKTGNQALRLGAIKHATAVVGKELDAELSPEEQALQLKTQLPELQTVFRAGPIEASGKMASLGGYTIVLELESAAKILGIPEGEATRIDLMLAPGADPLRVRSELDRVVANRGMVRTPGEQDSSMQSAMAGMQTAFSLCGAAALVVGLFLVYNALAVTVTERRHEIGILLSLGATRAQIRRLFAGEAAVLGLVGSILGIPLGIGMARFGLDRVRDVLNKIFLSIDVSQVDVALGLIASAVAVGMLTAVLASLAPAITAARANPAEAVRRITRAPTLHRLMLQAVLSAAMTAAGSLMILFRGSIPLRFGTYGGLMFVLVGALVASPFFAALAARLIAPLVRGVLGIEWRLAADNLVRSPGRTGLVIGALAAGVSLVVQTAGTIRSNRIALDDWVRDSIPADIIVARGGLVGGGGQLQSMQPEWGEEIATLPGVERVLPVRMRDFEFRDTKIRLVAVEPEHAYQMEKNRHAKPSEIELYRKLFVTPGGVLMSENFAALHNVHVGDTITLPSSGGEVRLQVVGQVVDYSWNKGTLLLGRHDLITHWRDKLASFFDVYLKPNAAPERVKEMISSKLGAQYGLQPLTRSELQAEIAETIESLYGIGYAQQIVVMLVAALGVVMALLIAVLQRRREIGLLRAIGASRGQVIYSVLAEAALMGLIGTAIGLAVGIPLQWYILEVVILEESGFLFPAHIPWLEGLSIAIAAIVTATLAGYGPALHSVRQRIPDAIAYE